MNSQIPKNHLSYQNHRRQFWLQIFLPMILTVLLIFAVATLTTLAAFGGSGDAPRWAAISTIWLVIPIMLFGLLVLTILVGLVYVMARGLKEIPTYTSQAQQQVNRAKRAIKHYSDTAAKPVFFIEGITASLKAIFGKK